jgi:hypothetical protein
MAKTMPVVRSGLLLEPEPAGASIQLDTPAWFAWLAAPTTTHFAYALFNRAQGYIDGFLTVRKERRQRGNSYWVVYRRQGARVRKVYVGPAAALTQARLDQIAARLHQVREP